MSSHYKPSAKYQASRKIKNQQGIALPKRYPVQVIIKARYLKYAGMPAA
jgi:hypothetical protein